MKLFIIFFAIFLAIDVGSTAKIAMMPHFGLSHYLVMAKLGDELKDRGHEVVIFVGDEATFAIGKPNVQVFNVPTEQGEVTLSEFFKSMASFGHSTAMKLASELLRQQKKYCNALLSNKNAMNELKNTDVLIGDSFYVCSGLVAAKFDLPHVAVTMSQLSTPIFSLYGIYSDPSYVPQMTSALPPKLKFLDRVQNFVFFLLNKLVINVYVYPTYKELKMKHNIKPRKTIKEILSSVDMVLVQKDLILDFAQPLPPNVREVGFFLPGPAKPLPADLEKFIESSGEDGVIIVSFGSIIEEFNDDVLQVMTKAFSKVPQKVIWKIGPLKGEVPSNIKTVSWLPQNDILGHVKTKLFVTHAGANGLAEAAYHGVPMICSPLSNDQFDNALFVEDIGMGEILAVTHGTADQLVSLIHQVINDKRYRERAKHVSNIIKKRKRPPVKAAADLVEYVQAIGNLDHLKPRGMDLPFYQYYMLDVLFLIGLVVALVLYVIVVLLKALLTFCCGSSRKIKRS